MEADEHEQRQRWIDATLVLEIDPLATQVQPEIAAQLKAKYPYDQAAPFFKQARTREAAIALLYTEQLVRRPGEKPADVPADQVEAIVREFEVGEFRLVRTRPRELEELTVEVEAEAQILLGVIAVLKGGVIFLADLVRGYRKVGLLLTGDLGADTGDGDDERIHALNLARQVLSSREKRRGSTG